MMVQSGLSFLLNEWFTWGGLTVCDDGRTFCNMDGLESGGVTCGFFIDGNDDVDGSWMSVMGLIISILI